MVARDHEVNPIAVNQTVGQTFLSANTAGKKCLSHETTDHYFVGSRTRPRNNTLPTRLSTMANRNGWSA